MTSDSSLKSRLRQVFQPVEPMEDVNVHSPLGEAPFMPISSGIASGKHASPEQIPLEPPSSSLDTSLIQVIVQQTVQATWGSTPSHAPPHVASPPAEALSPQELLTWKPQPLGIPHPPEASATPPSDPEAPSRVHIGSYQFSCFSFQEPIDRLQSGTTPDAPPLSQACRPHPQQALGQAMVTTEDPLAYNANVAIAAATPPASKGDTMVDLSEYKDLTQPPVTTGNGQSTAVLTPQEDTTEMEYTPMSSTLTTPYATTPSHPEVTEADIEIYGEYSGNVKTLVQLVNDLPEGVTKQTGAQIIRLTMEAMGISMETVLSDAQTVQSQLLDVVRSNIKKIEEYKTIIRKLETEIRYHQGKANELSEIIDLFILSNSTPNMPTLDRGNSDSSAY